MPTSDNQWDKVLDKLDKIAAAAYKEKLGEVLPEDLVLASNRLADSMDDIWSAWSNVSEDAWKGKLRDLQYLLNEAQLALIDLKARMEYNRTRGD